MKTFLKKNVRKIKIELPLSFIFHKNIISFLFTEKIIKCYDKIDSAKSTVEQK